MMQIKNWDKQSQTHPKTQSEKSFLCCPSKRKVKNNDAVAPHRVVNENDLTHQAQAVDQLKHELLKDFFVQ